MIIKEKSGVVEFKSQKDIIADRQKKTDQQYRDLQKRIGRIMKSNYHLAQSSLSERYNNTTKTEKRTNAQ